MSVTANEFATFMANMHVRLPAFIAADLPATVTLENDETREFVKDLTPASLPWVETFAVSHLASPAVAVSPENQKFTENLMRYVGEVFLRGIGGTWDYDRDGSGDGDGFPFLRLDTADGENAGQPVSMIGLVMTALQVRSGKVFVTRYAQEIDKAGESGPTRRSSGLGVAGGAGGAGGAAGDGAGGAAGDGAGGAAGSGQGAVPMDAEEQKFLGTFLPTVEPAVAAWVKDQAAPQEWTFEREGLHRLGKQVVARYDTVAAMVEDRSSFYIAGALRFVGEAVRRAGQGTWRYGTQFDVDDSRQRQPYIQFPEAQGDLVPWVLLTEVFKDPEAIATALDSVRDNARDNSPGTASTP